jgi:hypothetical protein
MDPPATDEGCVVTELFAIIRAAIAPNASRDERAAGAKACRTLIAALDARAGRRRAAPPDAALRVIPSERLLEMAMAKMRSVPVRVVSAPGAYRRARVPRGC